MVAVVLHTANAFLSPVAFSRHSTLLKSDSGEGGVEQIEFKIFPDGRVEETVRGIRGNNCHSVTDKINEALGKVVSSEPTEELYEQEIVLEQTLEQSENTNSDGDWEGSTSW